MLFTTIAINHTFAVVGLMLEEMYIIVNLASPAVSSALSVFI
jgi:hypothetical protein